MMMALSMIATVFDSTFFHKSFIASLTKTKPGTDVLLRYGSMYVDLPKVEMMSVLDTLLPPLGTIVTGP